MRNLLLAGLTGILFLVVLAACTALPALPPTATPAPPGPEAELAGAADAEPGVTLPLTQPLPSLVMLDAGVITATQTLSNPEALQVIELPVQGAFTIGQWSANGHHRNPVAVILPDAGRVCEANQAEEWPCPAGLQRNDHLGLRQVAQALAVRGYYPVIVNLNGEYTPAFGDAVPGERAVAMVDRLLSWMADDMRTPAAQSYGGEMSLGADYARILLVGHGRGAQAALAVAQARAGRTSEAEIAAGLGPVAGMLLVAPVLPEDAQLMDVPTSVVLAGCDADTTAAGLVQAAQSDPQRSSLIAGVLLPGASGSAFNAFAPPQEPACGDDTPLSSAQQQDWLARYAPDFADVATGYAPPYVAAGLDDTAVIPDTIYGLPVTATVVDPTRPGMPGQIQLFNLGETVVQQPVPAPADRMPLRVEGAFILPEGPGPHPLVLLLHLRGSKCFGQVAEGVFEAVWPCGPAAIPRYDLGYDYLLRALARRGYAVVAPNLVGAFTEAPSWAPPDDPAEANSMDYYRVEPLVDRLLAELAAANQGQSLAFGLDLTGQLDLGTLVAVGHSRGGEWANLLALRRAGNTSAEEVDAGRGPFDAVFLLTPAHGDFEDRDPHALRTADVPLAVSPAYCDGDLKENPLLGQAYLEQALQADGRLSPAWVVAVKTGEHYAYNTRIDFPEYNPSATFCQDREQFLPPEAARSFLAQLVPDFLDVALGKLPASAIPGFDPTAPLPDTLYGAPVEITALPAPEQRLLLGDAAQVQGALQASLCQGTGDDLCIVDETVELRPEAPPDDWAFNQPKFAGYPPQLRLQWDAVDARLALAVPEGSGNLSDDAALCFRVLVDMFDPRNAQVDSQSFSVALGDAAGNTATVVLPPSEPALIKDRGERSSIWNWAYFPLRARSVRIPLSDFQGVDLSQVATLAFVFDQNPQGSLLLSDVEFVR